MSILQRILPSALVAAALFLAGCKRAQLPDLPPQQPVAEPDPSQVTSVLFLIGDAGYAVTDGDPILTRLRMDVEEWSGRVQADSAVAVLFLGDNIYPRGLRERNTPEFAADSANLMGQVETVNGPQANTRKAFGVFISGNHDWGQAPAPRGLERAKYQAAFLTQLRKQGRRVEFMPEPGDPDIGVIDVGTSLRLVLLDTAWWLLGSNVEGRIHVLERMEQALRSRGNRDVVIAAHHPFKSASSHGGLVPFWQSLGIRMLLARSGAVLQDLNSIPYRDFKNNASVIFGRSGAPLVFVGGHDHALQVIEATAPDEPRLMLVSGAGSKQSKVGYTDGMRYRSVGPGYMRLMKLKDGRVLLFVTAADKDPGHCKSSDAAAQQECLAKGAAAFKTTYSMRVK